MAQNAHTQFCYEEEYYDLTRKFGENSNEPHPAETLDCM
jgi:hypothetical protein